MSTIGTGGGSFTASPTLLAAAEAYARIDSMIDRVRDTAAERDRARATAVDLEGQLAEALDLLREVTFGDNYREYEQWCVRRFALLAAVEGL